MARNPFGHIGLLVGSLDDATPLYEVLLPALGFVHRYHGERWRVWGGNRLEVYHRLAG